MPRTVSSLLSTRILRSMMRSMLSAMSLVSLASRGVVPQFSLAGQWIAVKATRPGNR